MSWLMQAAETSSEPPADGTEATQVFTPAVVQSMKGQDVVLAVSGTKSIYLKVVYEDFVELDTTNDKASLTFSWNGSCVTSSSNHEGYWYWRTGTGWQDDVYGGDATRICSYAETHTFGHFHNDPFCGSAPRTWNRYWYVDVRGQENGNQTNIYNTEKSGGCSGGLHRQVISS